MSVVGEGVDVAAVTTEQWLPALAGLHQRGLVVLDLLTGIDRVEALGAVEVVARVVDPVTAAAATVTTLVPAHAAVLASAASVYPAAAWHERETAEMFGVRFDGHPDPRPLLLAGHAPGPPPLRRSTPLAERLSTPWPGAVGSTGRGRRRASPPGVPASWQDGVDG